MGPGHTLMAKCSCIEILTGEAGGIEEACGVVEGEEADEDGLEVEEGGMAKWVVEGGGGGFETLMWTVKVDCEGVKQKQEKNQGREEGVRSIQSKSVLAMC